MNMRTKQTFRWFSEQCPKLDMWLKDSPVAEHITAISVYQIANDLVHLEFSTGTHQFTIITTSESEPYTTLMSFSFSDRYGDRPMSKGLYEKSTWREIEADILRTVQSGTSKVHSLNEYSTFRRG